MNGSITVYGNVFQKVDYSVGAVFFGTCDSHIENNLFEVGRRAGGQGMGRVERRIPPAIDRPIQRQARGTNP